MTQKLQDVKRQRLVYLHSAQAAEKKDLIRLEPQ